MSNFGALWDVAKPLYPASGNPQGNLALPVGTLAVSPCGNVYVKRGGGSTAYGWYLLNSAQSRNWQPLFVTGAGQMGVNASGQLLVAGPTTLINGFMPTKSGLATAFDANRQYMGGYTSGVALNSFLYRLQNNTDYMPSMRFDDSLVLNFTEFDLYWDIVTTPRSNSAAGSTDLTTNAMRIWAGGAWGSSAIQTVGGTASSDTLATEWPTALNVTNGLFGFAFRWSSAIDVNWKFVTTRCAAGAYTQTVTDMLVPPTANSIFRLRCRFIKIAGVVTALASINDGTEIAITGDVGSSTLAVGQTQPFQPLASVRQINATVKSMAVAECGFYWGVGVGASGC